MMTTPTYTVNFAGSSMIVLGANVNAQIRLRAKKSGNAAANSSVVTSAWIKAELVLPL